MPEKSRIRFRHFPYRAGKVKTFRTKKRNTVMKKMNEREVLHMKRKFSNTVTKRLVSAFLVLAMVVTIIPVTNAEAKKKYQYKHTFYTVDGRKTDGHKEEIINTGVDKSVCPTSDYGLTNVRDYSDIYEYGLNADEVKRLAAGDTVTIHLDRFEELFISEYTNVSFEQLFVEISYTDKKGKRKDKKDILWANDADDSFRVCPTGLGSIITDADITLRFLSKAIYKKYTRFELPKGEKGKKKYTYKISLYCGTKTDPDEREKQCKNNYTVISTDGLEEPIEYYLGKGKWGYMNAPLGENMYGELYEGCSFTIRGKYTHRKLTYRITLTKKKTGKLVYDKFEHESQLGLR